MKHTVNKYLADHELAYEGKYYTTPKGVLELKSHRALDFKT